MKLIDLGAQQELIRENLEERQRVARTYSEGLRGKVEVPFVPEKMLSAWAQYSILTDRRDDLEKYL